MSTETTKKKIKIDNGTNFARAYTDKAIDAKLPTDLKATATNLSLLAGDTKIGSGINLSGFEYDEATKTLKASGGGGASVSPTLNLIDMSGGGEPRPRTSISEEEKTNLEKGLYNSVFYADLSLGTGADYSAFFPEPLVKIEDRYIFSFYTFSFDETTQKLSIVGSTTKNIQVGEKNADGTYQITINDEFNEAIPFAGGGGGSNGIETIEVSNGTHNSDGSYTYTLPNKPTSNPYILKTVDSGESSYYLMTGDSNLSFGMRPIALSDSFFGGNFMVVSGTTATQRPTNFPPQPKSTDEGKVLTVKNGYPYWETAGGGGVSPILNLMNLDDTVRTSITEEEKNNLDKGLYTSVFYYDESWGENAEISITLPQLLTNVSSTTYMATIYTGSSSENSFSISGLLEYRIEIGEKSTDGTYPLTIEKAVEIPFAGGGGGSSLPAITSADVGKFLTVTSEQKTAWGSAPQGNSINAVIAKKVDDSITITKKDFDNLKKNDWELVIDDNNHQYTCTKMTIGTDDTGQINEIVFSYDVFTQASNILVLGTYQFTLSNDSLTAQQQTFETLMTKSKIFNKEVMTWNSFLPQDILPCTTADNGKALSVVNGEAKWADLGTTYSKARYEHTITIKNSAGKILWTQTMRNSSNTVVNSYTNLKTLFGEATYAGYGEYCQLDLRGGTEATDKLIKADGTEATLESLGAIVYTDVCFLPK